jgi:hypothetical protein
MDRFLLTLKMASPVVTGGGYMTLDALLAAILYDEHGDLERAHSEIPLQCTDGLWHASAAIYEKQDAGRIAFVANLRAMHDLDPDLLAKNPKGAIHRRIGLSRRQDYGAVMRSYRQISVDSISWYGEGDIKRIEELISGIHFIGKRRGSGFGEIAGFSMESADLDGLQGPFDEPLRPIPEGLFKGDTSSLRADAAWKPAYWHPENRAVCYVPDPVT